MRKIAILLAVLCWVTATVFAQSTIRGKIMDAKDGFPIAGATIKVRGERLVTVSQADGRFEIISRSGKVLDISEIGHFSQTVTYEGHGVLEIKLAPDLKALAEVVVTGVGTATSKKKLGISVESITADKLPAAPTSSISQALVGKIAGAQISSTDGTPGAKTNILLRGVNSLRGGTLPMILVDGIEVRATDIGSLDLNNVERVEVVEGAASSTIYGAQGANGVIQIFSKKGKAGQTRIDFSSSYGVSNYLNIGDLHKANTHGFKTDANNNVVDANGVIIQVKPDGTYTAGVNIAGVTQGGIVWNSTSPVTDGSKPYGQNFKYYDHLAQLFQSATNFNSSVSVSGGAGKTDYALTLSRTEQESAIRKNGELERTNFSSNMGTELFKGFKLRSTTQLVYQKNNFNPYFTAGPGQIFSALNTSPFFDLEWKDANGNYAYVLPASPVSVNGRNPNYYFQYSYGSNQIIDVIQNIQASYKVNRFLDIDFKYGINYQKEDINQVYLNQSQNINAISRSSFLGGFSSNKGGISNYSYTTTFQNALTTANLHLDLEREFHIKLPIVSTTLIGYDYRKNVYKQYNTTGDGLQLYPIYNMLQTDTRTITSDLVRPFVTFGTFINESLDYGDIAGIKGGFRSDYSSAFGRGSNAQTFYNGNAYFRLSQLNLWDNLRHLVTEFKIRGGYGEAGIQPNAFDRYVTLSTRQLGTGLAFYTPSTQSNPDLTVEISKESEIGADFIFELSKGKWLSNISLSTTLWKRTSSDIIYTVDAAPSSGGGGYLTNAYSLESNGYTFALNLNVLKSRNFNWDFTTNFNHQTSKIGSVSTGQDIIVTSSAGYGNYVLRAGSKIGQLFGLKTFTSLDETRQNGTAYIAKGDQGKYAIVNGYVVDTATKGLQFTNELYAFGDPNPKFNMAFINSLSYKGLSLSFQFDWIYGSHLYNQTKEWMYRDGIHGDYEKKITVNGQTAAFSNYYVSAYGDMWGSINGARNSVKDYFYEDASFLRLRNVSLAFNATEMFPIKYVRKLQLVLTGRNLLTFTKYTGMDPETNSGTSNSGFDRGVDYVTTPNSRTFQVGLNVGF
ncbi:MAG: SusC/RagA family TonB-linked outer membrane protein [Ferruginibacter sp.]|nr:SusC/RagA family TonB-linked outer membrane protein [Ferruginibacter sp.]